MPVDLLLATIVISSLSMSANMAYWLLWVESDRYVSNLELVIRLRPIFSIAPPVMLPHSTVTGTHHVAAVAVACILPAAVGIVIVGVAVLAPSGTLTGE